MHDIEILSTADYRTRATHSTIDRFRRLHASFAICFVVGTVIAATGWYFEWRQILPNFDVWISIAGHALQVLGVFGSLLTPDSIELEVDDSGSNNFE